MFFGMNIGKSTEIRYEDCKSYFYEQTVQCLKFFSYLNIGSFRLQYRPSVYTPIATGKDALEAIENEAEQFYYMQQKTKNPPESAVHNTLAVALTYQELFPENAKIMHVAENLMNNARGHCTSEERFKEIKENTKAAVEDYRLRKKYEQAKPVSEI